MAYWTKEELEEVLENDFLLNPKAFSPGGTNDAVVDSMIICFALDREWTELFAKWVDNYTITDGKYEYINHFYGDTFQPAIGSSGCPPKELEIERILEHYKRVKKWLDDKERHYGFERGNLAIMDYAINY